MLKLKTCDLKHEIDKHAVLLVRKGLNGNVCTNFQDYFMINEHNLRTKNRNILLKIPRIKLEFAKDGFSLSVLGYTTHFRKISEKVQMILRRK